MLLLLLGLTGCSVFKKDITLYPITDTDFRVDDNGTPDDPEDDKVVMAWWFYKEVLDVKLKSK